MLSSRPAPADCRRIGCGVATERLRYCRVSCECHIEESRRLTLRLRLLAVAHKGIKVGCIQLSTDGSATQLERHVRGGSNSRKRIENQFTFVAVAHNQPLYDV